MSSTGPGPTRTSATASTITPSCCAPSRSRRCAVRGCSPGPMRSGACSSARRSRRYLILEFFVRLGATLAPHAGMRIAGRAGRAIASALFLADRTTLYGRYWGATEHLPLLHFECCYYQAIEYAIARGLQAFEGGAQGEHKLFRGLLPVEAFSAHWLAHPKFARAVEGFLEREAAGTTRYVNELCDPSPFKDLPGG